MDQPIDQPMSVAMVKAELTDVKKVEVNLLYSYNLPLGLDY